MKHLFPSSFRTILAAGGSALIMLGLLLRGRKRPSKPFIIGLITGCLLIILAFLTASSWYSGLMKAESRLLEPWIAGGRFLRTWIPGHALGIKIFFLAGAIPVVGILAAGGRKKFLPLLLLICSAGAGLIGGIYLSEGEQGGAVIFLLLAGLYAWTSGIVSRKIPLLRPPEIQDNWKRWIILSGIILLGFLLRTYQLGEVSYRFDHYEADYAREALRVLSGRHNPNLWQSTIWRGLGHLNYSPIYIYLTAFFFKIFGATLLSLKMVAVFWGVLALFLTYAIIQTLFGRRLALITTFFLAVSPLHINYSRIGLLLCSTMTVSLLMVFFLLQAIVKNKKSAFIFLGVTGCFAGYFYSPAKYPILLSGFLLAVFILTRRGFLRTRWPGILLMTAAIFLVTLAFNIPTRELLEPSFADYESVWHRTGGHQYTPEADYLRALPLIRENLDKLVKSFFLDRSFNYDPWPRGNLYFNPLIPVLAIFGLFYSLANIKKINYRLLLFFSAAFLIPNLLSRPPVMVRRMMVSWPFIYCLAAIPLSQLLLKIRQLLPRPASKIAGGLVAGFLLCLGGYNASIFFESEDPAGRWEEERFFDEYARELNKNYYLYLIPINDLSRKTLTFLLNQEGDNGSGFQYLRSNRIDTIRLEEISGKLPAAVVGAAGRLSRNQLVRLQDKLGAGKIEEYRDRFNRPRAISLIIDRLPPSGNTDD